MLNNYIFHVETLRNGHFDDIHGSHLKIFRVTDLDEKALMQHVLWPETDRSAARLFSVVEQDEELFMNIRWKRLSASNYTRDLIHAVPKVTRRLLYRKSTWAHL